MLEQFAIAIAANAVTGVSAQILRSAFDHVSQKRPDLEVAAQQAGATGDIDAIASVFEQAVGVIVADAGTGEIEMDDATLNALKGVKFDHQHGEVRITGSSLAADVLVIQAVLPARLAKLKFRVRL